MNKPKSPQATAPGAGAFFETLFRRLPPVQSKSFQQLQLGCSRDRFSQRVSQFRRPRQVALVTTMGCILHRHHHRQCRSFRRSSHFSLFVVATEGRRCSRCIVYLSAFVVEVIAVVVAVLIAGLPLLSLLYVHEKGCSRSSISTASKHRFIRDKLWILTIHTGNWQAREQPQ